MALLPKQGITCDAAVASSTQLHGCGVLGEVDGHALAVGTADFMTAQGVSDPAGSIEQTVAEWGTKGKLSRAAC